MFLYYILFCTFEKQNNHFNLKIMNKHFQVSRNCIEKTEAFQKLSKIQQKITLSKTTVLHIENGVNVSLNIGFDAWDKQTKFSTNNRSIVLEIYNKKKENENTNN